MFISLKDVPIIDGIAEFRLEGLEHRTMPELQEHYGRFDLVVASDVWDKSHTVFECTILRHDIFAFRNLNCLLSGLPDLAWRRMFVAEYVRRFCHVDRVRYDKYQMRPCNPIEEYHPIIHKWEYENRVEFTSDATITKVFVVPLPARHKLEDQLESDGVSISWEGDTTLTKMYRYIARLKNPVPVFII